MGSAAKQLYSYRFFPWLYCRDFHSLAAARCSPFDFYIRRVYAAFKLVLLFSKELILANIDMIKIVLSPKMNIEPGIVAVPTELESEWEVTLLASLISLTPGTLSMDFSEDSKILYIHSVHVPDREEAIKQIHDTFERAIKEVTH